MRGETRDPGDTGEGERGDRGPSESRPGVRQCEAGPGEGDSSDDTRLSCGQVSKVRLERIKYVYVTKE